MLKHLHNFFNKYDIPWIQLVWNTHYGNEAVTRTNRRGSFWWKDVLKLLDSFKEMALVSIGDDSTTLFWSDAWHGDLLIFSGLIFFLLPRLILSLLKPSLLLKISQTSCPISVHDF